MLKRPLCLPLARMAVVCLSLSIVFPVHAQTAEHTAEKLPVWDVVSVHPTRADDRGMSIRSSPGSVVMKGISLSALVSNAYGLRSELIFGGPAWMETERFDVEAKMAPADVPAHPLSIAQRRLMLQALLRDRFAWTGHTEVRQLPVYDLVVARSGSKLKRSAVGDTYAGGLQNPDSSRSGAGMMMVGNGTLVAQAAPVSDLVQAFAGELERDVIDKTGLTGDYDVKLKWSPDDGPLRSNGSDATDTGESIFTAVQEQLGLKLVPSKGPVLTLVVDHIEKPKDN